MDTLKELPYDIKAEQAILGIMLVDKDATLETTGILKPEFFYSGENQIVYTAMVTLSTNGIPIDIITVKNELEKMGKFEKIGGYEYLSNLTEEVSITSNLENYIEVVLSKYKLRQIIQTAVKMQKLSYDSKDPKDIIDLVEKEVFDLGKDETNNSLERINKIIIDTFIELDELNKAGSNIVGVPSGFIDLDRRTTGFKKSSLIILAARPGMGKSALANNIATNAAIRYNIPTLIFNLEMSKNELVKRMLASEALVDNTNLNTGRISTDEMERLSIAGDELSEAEIYIDDTAGIDIMNIRAKARKLKIEKNIGLIVVDYLQLIEPAGRRNSTREQEISEISRSLKKLAMELNIPIIALSQLSRSAEKGETRRPMLSDLRESGAIEQDADMVLFIYRDDYYNKETDNPNTAEIIIAKNRGGQLSTVQLLWMGSFTKFENYGDRDEEERF